MAWRGCGYEQRAKLRAKHEKSLSKRKHRTSGSGRGSNKLHPVGGAGQHSEGGHHGGQGEDGGGYGIDAVGAASMQQAYHHATAAAVLLLLRTKAHYELKPHGRSVRPPSQTRGSCWLWFPCATSALVSK
jgi:hypothetical protein